MMLSLYVFCLVFSLSVGSKKFHTPPSYVIDLDKPPQERWLEVVRDYRNQMKKTAAVILKHIPREFHDYESLFHSKIKDFFPAPFLDEIKGIAAAGNMTLDEAIYPNIAHELFESCTSIVTLDKNGVIWHARNMDYVIEDRNKPIAEITDMLRDMTIRVNFQRAGKTVYTGITFAGYVGLVTGQRPNAFTVSVNSRASKTVLQTIRTAFGNNAVKLISLLVRQVIEKAASFRDAEHQLASAVTATDIYFILGGVGPNEGTVISKGRTESQNIRRLMTETGRWYLVQTNSDIWKNRSSRRIKAIKLIEKMGRNITKKRLFGVISTYPVCNDITVYQVVMSAAKPDLFASRVITSN